MRKLIVILVVVFSNSCYGSKNDVQIYKANTDTIKKDPSIIYRKIKGEIFATLRIKSFSADSVIAITNFVNNSNESIFLYKPLLPTNNLDANVFHINVLDVPNIYEMVPFIGHSINNYYDEEDRDLIIISKPEIKPGNLVVLKAKGIDSFKINIARFYNFHTAINQNHTKFQIGYIALMPYIVDNKHVFAKDPIDKLIKPVYTAISTNRYPKRMEEMVRFSIPK